MARFQAYLRTMVSAERDELELAPLVMMNPMGKDHVPARLDELLSMDADGVAARAVADAAARLADVPGNLKVGLVLADDAMGGWTNRYAAEFDHRFRPESQRFRNRTRLHPEGDRAPCRDDGSLRRHGVPVRRRGGSGSRLPAARVERVGRSRARAPRGRLPVRVPLPEAGSALVPGVTGESDAREQYPQIFARPAIRFEISRSEASGRIDANRTPRASPASAPQRVSGRFFPRSAPPSVADEPLEANSRPARETSGDPHRPVPVADSPGSTRWLCPEASSSAS
jgi:hypothetical protein